MVAVVTDQAISETRTCDSLSYFLFKMVGKMLIALVERRENSVVNHIGKFVFSDKYLSIVL